MDAGGAAEPYSTFSAGSVEDALDLRLPSDLKNRLRTACLPGPGLAAVEPPDADFLRGIAVCRRAGRLRAQARGHTSSRLRARARPELCGAWPVGGGAGLGEGGALAAQIGCAADFGGAGP